MKLFKRLLLSIVAVVALTTVTYGQGALSNQVLQLLTRVNAWTTTNTFSDIRLPSGPCGAIPSITAGRIYTDASCNLYFNGGLIAGSGGGVTPHNLLSTTHSDTVASSPVRGGMIVANSTPAWAQVAIGANHTVWVSNGTDPGWSTDGSGLTGLNAANLTGTIAAISGVNLTNLNASNLGSGTVPLARISGLTNSQLSGTAGITYANLTLTGGIVNADINAAAAIAYSKLTLTGSVVSGDLASGTLLFNRWAQNSASANQVPMWNGSAWVATTITQAVVTNAGTVTSVAASVPSWLAISGSPITTSGTLAITANNESANTVLAGPTSGGAAGPSFRSMVNADLPTSGAVAGSYPFVTVNAQGVVTAGSTSIALGTVTSSTPLAVTETWNNAGVNFSLLQVNATNTASGATSLLADFQLGGVSKWNVDKNGNVTSAGGVTLTTGTFSGAVSTGALTSTTGAFSGLLSPNAGVTVPTGQTATVTDIDKLLVGGNKIPNTRVIWCENANANSLSGDCMFIMDRAYQVTSIKIEQAAQGGAGCVIDMEKLTGTTAPGGGTVLGTGSYDCNGTANNTVTTYTLTGTTGTLQFAAGDRLGIKLGGSLTALRGGTVMVQMKAL